MSKASTFVVRLPESFAGKVVSAVKREIRSVVRQNEAHLVMDLSRVRQIDCAGLDMLLDCMVELSRGNGSLSLADVSPEAAVFLELGCLDRAFGMFPSVAEAVDASPAKAGKHVPAQVSPVPQPAAA